ncbi:hypothetical protein J1N35_022125 [Gossypium stocksii]|uniref:Uncharacterized protein n=1 Tax=Gossypium stocksii TaxID=47602 RepID=A0A9D3VH46_9ROSI|nr:hypothetical protein J1N35_022125 [Gossypium stocksii]
MTSRVSLITTTIQTLSMNKKRSKLDKIDELIGNHGDLIENGSGFSDSKVKSKESKKKKDLRSKFDGEGIE